MSQCEKHDLVISTLNNFRVFLAFFSSLMIFFPVTLLCVSRSFLSSVFTPTCLTAPSFIVCSFSPIPYFRFSKTAFCTAELELPGRFRIFLTLRRIACLVMFCEEVSYHFVYRKKCDLHPTFLDLVSYKETLYMQMLCSSATGCLANRILLLLSWYIVVFSMN